MHSPPSGSVVSSPDEASRPLSSPTRISRSWPSGTSRSRASASNDLAGQIIDSYRLEKLIGSGGMGDVYLAEHIQLGRQVAVKLLRPEYASRPESVARFSQEAWAVNQIGHRNIVDIPHIGRLEDDTPFIIMELLDGDSLRDWIVEHNGETDRLLNIFVQICDGLAAAHDVDIIHRDLKPDNIMVVTDHDGKDLAKLLDFGIAKLINREEEEGYGWKTTEGFVMGTPAYMAPEQAGGLPIDRRTDIYALGAIMYEMFTGEPVFTGKSAGEFVRKHLNELPKPPHQTEGGQHIDRRIESVIMRCLAKDPIKRYTSAIAMRRDLQRILAGEDLDEAAATTPLRMTGRSDVPSGPISIATSHPSVKDLHDSQPGAQAEQPAHAAGSMTPVHHKTHEVVGDLRGHRARGRRILWSMISLAVTAGAIAAWFLLPAILHGQASSESTPGNGSQPDPRPAEKADLTTKEGPIITRRAPEVESATPSETVSIRFESSPSAKVYDFDSPEPKCETPCDLAFPIDDPLTRRIILSREHYHPKIVDLDMSKPPGLVRVKLQRERRSSRSARPRRSSSRDRPVRDGMTTIKQSASDKNTGRDIGAGSDSANAAPPSGEKDPANSSGADSSASDESQSSSGKGRPDQVSPSKTLDPFDK
ncbi:MAG: serine/threonine protein kinase [Proteobacteria bacterium]|nr:serine/threonine protein kinase [Pseudomonadota bacterium]